MSREATDSISRGGLKDLLTTHVSYRSLRILSIFIKVEYSFTFQLIYSARVFNRR